jgi:hypothetical protein
MNVVVVVHALTPRGSAEEESTQQEQRHSPPKARRACTRGKTPPGQHAVAVSGMCCHLVFLRRIAGKVNSDFGEQLIERLPPRDAPQSSALEV